MGRRVTVAAVAANVFRERNEMSLTQFIEATGVTYSAASMLLGRLVRNGRLMRLGRGYFRVTRRQFEDWTSSPNNGGGR